MKKLIRYVALMLALAIASVALNACSSSPRVINLGGSGQGVVIYE